MFYTRAMVAIFVGTAVYGCAHLTDWKEQNLRSGQDRQRTFLAASQVLGRIGKVTNSDAAAGTITGECSHQVEGSILVYEQSGSTFVLVKSRATETPHLFDYSRLETARKRCIDRITEELGRAGITTGR